MKGPFRLVFARAASIDLSRERCSAAGGGGAVAAAAAAAAATDEVGQWSGHDLQKHAGACATRPTRGTLVSVVLAGVPTFLVSYRWVFDWL